MCKGSQTTTQTTGPNPAAMQQYLQIMQNAQGISQMPYQSYTGELVAPINAQQQQGISNINANASFATPYITQAAAYANKAGTPVGEADINQYLSPYNQDVIAATQAQFANMNAQQLAQVKGNAAAQGALGGNREAVAEGVTAGQQALNQAPTIAGLENQNYAQALNTALTQKQMEQGAAYSLANLGVAGQNAALTGANAQFGVGTAEQQTANALDALQRQQFYQSEFAPEAMQSWLAGIASGVGSQMGGTSTTQGPTPSMLSQILGLGAGTAGAMGSSGAFGSTGWLAGMFANRGGRVPHRDLGGGIAGGAAGAGGSGVGSDIAGVSNLINSGLSPYLPTMQITRGQGAPPPPKLPGDQSQSDLSKTMSGIGGWFKGNNSGTPSGVDMTQDAQEPDPAGTVEAPVPTAPGPGDTWESEGVWRRGGRVGYAAGGIANQPIILPRGYADGGAPDYDQGNFDDRFGAAFPDYGGDIPLPRPRPQGIDTPEGEVLVPGSWVPSSTGEGTDRGGYRMNRAVDAAPIDATDLVIRNVGLGQPWSNTNDAIRADSGVPTSVPSAGVSPGTAALRAAYSPTALPPEILTGSSSGYPADDMPPGVLAFAPTTGGGGVAGDVPLPPPRPADAGSGDVPLPRPRPMDLTADDPETATRIQQQHPGIDWSANSKLWPALMAAGFGMMASRSPFPGVAIGEGGLAGVQTYQKEVSEERAAKMNQASIDLKAKQLSQQADQFQANLNARYDITPYQQRDLDIKEKSAMALAAYREAIAGRGSGQQSGFMTEEGHPVIYDKFHPGAGMIDAQTLEPITDATKLVPVGKPGSVETLATGIIRDAQRRQRDDPNTYVPTMAEAVDMARKAPNNEVEKIAQREQQFYMTDPNTKADDPKRTIQYWRNYYGLPTTPVPAGVRPGGPPGAAPQINAPAPPQAGAASTDIAIPPGMSLQEAIRRYPGKTVILPDGRRKVLPTS